MRRLTLMVLAAVLLAWTVGAGLGLAQDKPAAQEKPRTGGELIFVVPSEPPTYDGHAEGTFGLVTAVTVRLLHLPEAVKTVLALFTSVEIASEAVSAIIASGGKLRSREAAAATKRPTRQRSLYAGTKSVHARVTRARLARSESVSPTRSACSSIAASFLAQTALKDLKGDIDLIARSSQAAGASMDSHNAKMQTFTGQWEALKNTMTVIAEGLGDTMVPVLKGIVGGIQEVISLFRDAAEGARRFREQIASLFPAPSAEDERRANFFRGMTGFDETPSLVPGGLFRKGPGTEELFKTTPTEAMEAELRRLSAAGSAAAVKAG